MKEQRRILHILLNTTRWRTRKSSSTFIVPAIIYWLRSFSSLVSLVLTWFAEGVTVYQKFVLRAVLRQEMESKQKCTIGYVLDNTIFSYSFFSPKMKNKHWTCLDILHAREETVTWAKWHCEQTILLSCKMFHLSFYNVLSSVLESETSLPNEKSHRVAHLEDVIIMILQWIAASSMAH